MLMLWDEGGVNCRSCRAWPSCSLNPVATTTVVSTPEDESLPLADAEEGQTPSENDEEKPKAEFKKPGGVKVMITGGLAFLIAVGIGLAVHLTVGLPKRKYHGAVAADVSECSVIGTDMISKGGSAVDAAVASMLCLGVMHGQSSGLGGGGFMVVRSKDGDIEAIDFRSTAAALANVTMFVNNRNLALRGGLAVAVPGELKALWEVHQKYGLLDWSELFQPSIQLAKNGFRVTEHLARAIDRAHDYFLSPLLREIYTLNGVPLQENDTAYNPNLANTLGMLANGTQGLFYDGPIAKSIVDEVKAHGGILEVSDFKNYSVIFSEPLQTEFGDFKVFSPQPPSSGAVLISILNILSGYDDQKNNSLFYHRLVEGYKFAYAQRSHLGDPAFVNITALIHNMTSLDYAAFLREHKIDDNATHHASYYGPAYDVEPTPGTTHLSVLGPDGDAVAVTSTVNTYFGSKLMTSTGIVLNNDMDDFSSPNITNIYNVRPSPANYIAPGKRPLSSQAPTLVIQRKPGSKKEFVHLATGASGGTKITTATAQVILYSLGMNDDVESAVERRRIHNQLMPNVTEVEDGFSDEVVENLRQIGHRVSFVDFGPSLGVVQAARADYPEDTIYNADAEPILTAHSDKRKGGIASVI